MSVQVGGGGGEETNDSEKISMTMRMTREEPRSQRELRVLKFEVGASAVALLNLCPRSLPVAFLFRRIVLHACT